MVARGIVSLFFITITVLFFNINLFAQDIDLNNNWLTDSAGKDDILILEYLNTVDFEEKIRAISNISKREDKNFSFLLDSIYYQVGDNINEKEYILYLMLDNFFTDETSINESLGSFLAVCNNISNYRNSILRKKIMEKTVLFDNNTAESILLKEALFLLQEGKKTNSFNIEMLEESRIFFIYSGKVDSPVLNDYRQEIYVTVINIPYSFIRKNVE